MFLLAWFVAGSCRIVPLAASVNILLAFLDIVSSDSNNDLTVDHQKRLVLDR
jgi:hypothetical protein